LSERVPEASLVGALTVVRWATHDDVDLLVTWHSDPDVARYWDHATFTREEMQERLDRPDVDAYIVMKGEQPVGYLQVWFDGEAPGEGGLDMFLIPSARDRGLGPDATRTVATWLMDAGVLRHVTADPYVTNARAVAAWTKAGFEPVEERDPDDDHTQPWLLMTFAHRS
jgi:aminoglycoside 6'-N-acetyltransferase